MNGVNRIRLQLPRADFLLDVDLCLPERGITVIFGPSGSGKTSLLRCVAGLERPAVGFISIHGELWQDHERALFLPPWQRRAGYVFQEPSLFEHLDVRGNLEYGLRRARALKGGTSVGILDEAIGLLGIRSLMRRMPGHLSGGERQRVAIARALAASPKVMLLDEPLASLDRARRMEILPLLERMRDELRVPMLYVTHSCEERDRLASEVVVLGRGLVQASGPLTVVCPKPSLRISRGRRKGLLVTLRR